MLIKKTGLQEISSLYWTAVSGGDDKNKTIVVPIPAPTTTTTTTIDPNGNAKVNVNYTNPNSPVSVDTSASRNLYTGYTEGQITLTYTF